MKLLIIGSLLGSLLVLVSCQQQQAENNDFKAVEAVKPVLEKEAQKEEPVAETTAATEVNLERGKRIWVTTCNQCHNKDPNVKGAIGPEVVDAPLEVMMSKVMTGKYPDPLPPGYVPKRKTSAMRALPKYGKDVPSIWAYVQSVKKKK